MNDNSNVTIKYASEYDLNRVDKRLSSEIKDNRDRIDDNSERIVKLETVYATLEELPNTIVNLDKTITIIRTNLESMNQNIREVREMVSLQEKAVETIRIESKRYGEDIARVDNKSKIDWAVFVTNNFWKIFLIFGAVYCITKFIIEK